MASPGIYAEKIIYALELYEIYIKYVYIMNKTRGTNVNKKLNVMRRPSKKKGDKTKLNKISTTIEKYRC